MKATGQSWLVFLHGINAGDDDQWYDALRQTWSRQGYEALPRERVVAPDYRSILRDGTLGCEPVKDTWEPPSKAEARRLKTAYLARMGHTESTLRPLANADLHDVKPPELGMSLPSVAILGEVTRYIKRPSVRAAIQRTVLDAVEAVPDGARVVIVGHSLGSVVAADVVKKLPARIHIGALVTIGSPLGFVSKLRSGTLDPFPFDRLESWVNVFEPRDPVTGGRGVSSHYRWALDIPVALEDWMIPALVHQHGAEYYCSHLAVGTAVARGFLGSDIVAATTPLVSVSGLEFPLLQSLYLRELSKRLPSDKAERLARFERAREAIATDNAKIATNLHTRAPHTAEP